MPTVRIMKTMSRTIAGPEAQARNELKAAIQHAKDMNRLDTLQTATLAHHLGVAGLGQPVGVDKRTGQLWSIANVLETRQAELLTRRFHSARDLAQTGMLALAVGNPNHEPPLMPQNRAELISAPIVLAVASNKKNAHVRRDVIVDKLLERDLMWLTALTVPKRGTVDT